jgi:ribosomal-protein-alanine N-acetyltransferase
MAIAETRRLRLRRLDLDDAPFILELVNDLDWLRFIGDKKVHSLDDARAYLENGPLDMYRRLGFGLLAMELKDGGPPIGMCGILRRPTLDEPDLGFALLPAHRRRGYTVEAARAVLAHGFGQLGLNRILAITSPDNAASGRVLEQAGFVFERMLQLTSKPNDEVRLFAATRPTG